MFMSGKGNCCDNAVVITFFKTIMAELTWRYPKRTCPAVKVAISACISGFYNLRGRYLALDWESLMAFEQKVTKRCTLDGTKA
jgi:transposase InsO family protein